MAKKYKIWPLHAVNNSFKSNWKLWDGLIKWVIKNELAPVVALYNAERIIDIKTTGKNVGDIPGLEEGMKVLGFNPKVDATNQLEREYSAPSGHEREDW